MSILPKLIYTFKIIPRKSQHIFFSGNKLILQLIWKKQVSTRGKLYNFRAVRQD